MGIGFTFHFENCTECRRCMTACSLVKTGKVRMQDARIKIDRRWPDAPEIAVCRYDDCAEHPCIAVCPVEAITNDNGLILIDEESCIGCEACVAECPYNAIFFVDEKAWKCDFCGGDPACVKECVTEAIVKKGD